MINMYIVSDIMYTAVGCRVYPRVSLRPPRDAVDLKSTLSGTSPSMLHSRAQTLLDVRFTAMQCCALTACCVEVRYIYLNSFGAYSMSQRFLLQHVMSLV